MEKHYLYTHYRLDSNEIFYVGIGTRSKGDLRYDTYTRAFSRYKRSDFWRNIVKINPDYIVTIVLESDDYNYIKSEEIRLIGLYGRRDKKNGTLCNLTDGGDGTIGIIYTDLVRDNMSKAARKVAKFGSKNHTSKKVYQYNLDGSFVKEWLCIEDCNREFGYQSAHIISCTKGRCKTSYGFQWFDVYKGNKVRSVAKGKSKVDGYLKIKDTRYIKKK